MRFKTKQIIGACDKVILENIQLLSNKTTEAANGISKTDWRGRPLTADQYYRKQSQAIDTMDQSAYCKKLNENIRVARLIKNLAQLSPFDYVDMSIKELAPIQHHITHHHGA